MSPRWFVTGGTGFVGRHIVEFEQDRLARLEVVQHVRFRQPDLAREFVEAEVGNPAPLQRGGTA